MLRRGVIAVLTILLVTVCARSVKQTVGSSCDAVARDATPAENATTQSASGLQKYKVEEPESLAKEGTAVAKSIFESIGKSWTIDSKYINEKLLNGRNDFGETIKLYSELLGPVQSIGTVQCTGSELIDSKIGAGYIVRFKANVVCQKDKAAVDLRLFKHENDWLLGALSVNSDVFNDYVARIGNEALQVSKKALIEMGKDWNASTVDILEESYLKRADLEKVLKKIGDCGSLKSINRDSVLSASLGSRLAVPCKFEVTCEKSVGTLILVMVKVDGAWKIGGMEFTVQR